MVVHQFEACYEDVQELLRARSVETGVAEGLNALQLLGDTAFPCFRVLYGDCKVALYHLVGHHAVYVRNGSRGQIVRGACGYRFVPGHFGRSLGSRKLPPNRARNFSAWSRWAKQKTMWSQSSRRNACVRVHSDRRCSSQKSRMVM